MKIGVDAAVLADNNGVKAGNYHLTHNLLKALGKIDKINKYFLYSYKPVPKNLLKCYPQNFLNLVIGPQKWWMQFRLCIEQLIRPVDVFVGLNQALPFWTKSKTVVFCLDLAFEKFSKSLSNAKKLSWQTKRAVSMADKVIALSKSTKQDLIKLYKINRRKIRVIYPD